MRPPYPSKLACTTWPLRELQIFLVQTFIIACLSTPINSCGCHFQTLSLQSPSNVWQPCIFTGSLLPEIKSILTLQSKAFGQSNFTCTMSLLATFGSPASLQVPAKTSYTLLRTNFIFIHVCIDLLPRAGLNTTTI